MYIKALPWVVALSFCWGTNLVVNRFSLGQFEPFNYIFLRLTISFAVVLLVLLLSGRRFPSDKEMWLKGMISGFIGLALTIPAFVISLRYISSGLSGVYTTLSPVLLVVAAHFFLPDEKLTVNKSAGVLIAFAGGLFLALRGETGLTDTDANAWLGVGIISIGLVASTVNTMFVRRTMQGMDVIQVTMIRILTAMIAMLIATILFGDFSLEKVETSGWFVLIYAALIGALTAQFLAFYIQRTHGATAYSLTAFLIPVFTIVVGSLALDELITPGMLIGMGLIGTGLYFLNRTTKTEVKT